MRCLLGTRTFTVIAAVLSVSLMVGCSTSRTADRAKVLEAENIHLRQTNTTMEQQMHAEHATLDDIAARKRQLEDDLAVARQDAAAAQAARTQAEMARERLVETQDELTRAEAALIESNRRLEELKNRPVVQPQPQRVAVRGGPTHLRMGGTSPEAEAMRRDLQNQLARFGVRGLNVEVRTDRTGSERVAIVLPDAFPSGKATLAYNKSAVKAVISVGKMIKAHYPSSRVLVEGHTDSDPIRKSDWGTNENLSRARASAVQTLLTNSGVPSTNVTTEGLGARQPLAQGSTKRAKSRNRRVEIFISPRG